MQSTAYYRPYLQSNYSILHTVPDCLGPTDDNPKEEGANQRSYCDKHSPPMIQSFILFVLENILTCLIDILCLLLSSLWQAHGVNRHRLLPSLFRRRSRCIPVQLPLYITSQALSFQITQVILYITRTFPLTYQYALLHPSRLRWACPELLGSGFPPSQ